MDRVDMVICNRNNDNVNSPIVIVDDRWAKTKGTPATDTVLGGTYDITVLGYELGEKTI
jgi:hypothetical protein